MTFVVCVLYLALVEYCVHRWYMHRPASRAWREHSIEHHHEERNDEYYLCPFWRSIAVFWAAGSLAFVGFDLWAPVILAGLMIWWRCAWIEIHRICHGVGNRRILATCLCPWASLVVRHHLRHHDRPARNFGAVFFVTDYLFGTAA